MSTLIVNGTKSLKGSVSVHGAKNSVLPLLAATYLCDSKCVLHNCPMLTDVKASIKILEHLGCKCESCDDVLLIDSDGSYKTEIPEDLMREMRSSIIFLGAVAAKCNKAVMSLPGGCELGPRPIDIHIDALKKMGAEIEYFGGNIECYIPNGFIGTEIHLTFPSVGATENIILAATKAKGRTVIYNAAREPEIVDLAMFLNRCGGKIYGAGSSKIIIDGVNKLEGSEHRVLSDRIVAATYLFAVAASRGKITLNDIVIEHLVPFVSCLKSCGCRISFKDKSLTLDCPSGLHNFDTISSSPFPGFPTDAGPLLVSSSTLMTGTGVFVENIFDNRFRYVDELKRLGADIKTVGRTAIITGVKGLSGADVTAHDLRGGAALVLAAICAKGQSKIRNADFIDRGYEKIEDMFSEIGADIKRI